MKHATATIPCPGCRRLIPASRAADRDFRVCVCCKLDAIEQRHAAAQTAAARAHAAYEKDFEWQRQFADAFGLIILKVLKLVQAADLKEDREHNTDFFVLRTAEDRRIACRLRRETWLPYDGEITIRESRPKGVTTELAKILSGWGDFFLYGFALATAIAIWTFLDLAILRLWWANESARLGHAPGTSKLNDDGTTFRILPLWPLPAGTIVARQGPPIMEPIPPVERHNCEACGLIGRAYHFHDNRWLCGHCHNHGLCH